MARLGFEKVASEFKYSVVYHLSNINKHMLKRSRKHELCLVKPSGILFLENVTPRRRMIMHKSLYVVNVDGTLALLRKQNNYCGLKDLNVETLAASPLC